MFNDQRALLLKTIKHKIVGYWSAVGFVDDHKSNEDPAITFEDLHVLPSPLLPHPANFSHTVSWLGFLSSNPTGITMA